MIHQEYEIKYPKGITHLTAREQVALVSLAQKGNDLARRKLIHSNFGYLHSVAMQYTTLGSGLGFSKEDIMGYAVLGMEKAIDKYTPDKKCDFLPMAIWWIRDAISKAMQNYGTVVRITSSIYQNKDKKCKTKELVQKIRKKVNYDAPANDHGDFFWKMTTNDLSPEEYIEANRKEESTKKVLDAISKNFVADRDTELFSKYCNTILSGSRETKRALPSDNMRIHTVRKTIRSSWSDKAPKSLKIDLENALMEI